MKILTNGEHNHNGPEKETSRVPFALRDFVHTGNYLKDFHIPPRSVVRAAIDKGLLGAGGTPGTDGWVLREKRKKQLKGFLSRGRAEAKSNLGPASFGSFVTKMEELSLGKEGETSIQFLSVFSQCFLALLVVVVLHTLYGSGARTLCVVQCVRACGCALFVCVRSVFFNRDGVEKTHTEQPPDSQ